MTPQQLLKERIKVIADYPGCKFKVGDILTYVREIAQTYDLWRNESTGVEITYSGFGAYPHLFKPLPWHEYRSPEDMPSFVKYKDGRVFKVTEHTGSGCILEGSMWVRYKNIQPATKEEYECYLKEKEGK